MKQEADAILDGYLEEGPPLEALAHLGARYMLQVALEGEVTADILLERGELDTVALFSGDSDFADLAGRLRDLGKWLVVYSSRKTLSWELKLACQEYRYLEDSRDVFERS